MEFVYDQDYGSLDKNLIELALDLAKLADRRPPNQDWASNLNWELDKLSVTTDHISLQRLKWLMTLMINGARPNQSKLSRLHEILNDINPEHPLNPQDAERIAVLKDMADEAQVARNNHLLHNSLRHLFNTATDRQEETSVATRKILLRRTWRAWMRVMYEKRLKKEYFNLWRLKIRFRIHTEDQNQSLLRDLLQNWRVSARHEVNIRIAINHNNRNKAMTSFQKWKQETTRVLDLEQKAQISFNKKIIQVSMDHIVDHIEHIKFLDKKAQAIKFYRLTTGSLNKMRRTAENRIAYRKEETRKNEIMNTYTGYIEQKRLNMALYFLTDWRNKTNLQSSVRIIQENNFEIAASDFRREKLLNASVSALSLHHARVQDLELKAKSFYTSHSQALARNTLLKISRIGTQKMAKLNTAEQLVQLFSEKHIERQTKSILNHWRSKLGISAISTQVTPPNLNHENVNKSNYLNTPSTRRRILLATPNIQNTGTPRTSVKVQTPIRQLTTAFRAVAQTVPMQKSVTFESEHGIPFRGLQLQPQARTGNQNQIRDEIQPSDTSINYSGSSQLQEVEFPDINVDMINLDQDP